MSAAGVVPPIPRTRVERRCRQTPAGIKIETWRLVDTRTLPAESAGLPFSVLFEEAVDVTELGAVPSASNDQADTLRLPVDGDVTVENPPPAYASSDSKEQP
ncbi:MAG TPA: hypothetical protein VHG72_18350 [Polyangia bacterium]|nr:hypothetical protein [Polyangia bacterium]